MNVERQVTIGELVKWIIENRTNTVFIGYKEEDIYNEVMLSLKHNALVYSLSSNGQIEGVTCGRVDDRCKTYFAINTIAKTTKALTDMIKWLIVTYPKYMLEARRTKKQKFMSYNPTILLRRLQ